MKRIIFFLTVFAVATAFELRAQDVAALEERVKQLRGHVDDLMEDKINQKKQIEALTREIQSLRDQQSRPNESYASNEDLRRLAEKLQELDDKRKTDREVILKEIEKLGRASGGKTPKPPKTPNIASPGKLPEKAIEHEIAAGDTLSTIAAAYSKEAGVKVTTDQILKANPGLVPEKLKVGQKILIPLPDK
jgi:LysM repeat protein